MTLSRLPFPFALPPLLIGGKFHESAVIKRVVVVRFAPINRRFGHQRGTVPVPQHFKVLQREKVLDPLAAVPLVSGVARIFTTLNDGSENGAQPIIKVVLLLPRFALRHFRLVLKVIFFVVLPTRFRHGSGRSLARFVLFDNPLRFTEYLGAPCCLGKNAAFFRTELLPLRFWLKLRPTLAAFTGFHSGRHLCYSL